jgi:hypothetical protein
MEKDTLKDDRDEFQACLDAEQDQRKESQDDLEFALLGKQWHEDDIAQRKEEGRPCLTINRLPSFGKQVTNDARMNRASINVKPVGGGADKATADIQSDLIRNIETQSQANQVYDTAFHFAVHCGFGYYRVNVDYTCEDAWDQDIMLGRINNPFSVYGDYESKEATSIDWNRAFVTDFYGKSAFEARWGKDRKASNFEIGSGDYDKNWFKDKRIRVAERWKREEVPVKLLKLSDGSLVFESEFLKNVDFYTQQQINVSGDRDTKTYKVTQRLITGTDVLEENAWLGKYIPIVPMYGEEVNVNGKRYFISLIRRAKDPQRMVNYWRSCSTELVALAPKAPWVGAVGQFATDAVRWNLANRKSYSSLEYDVIEGAPPPQRQPFAGVPAGALQEALNASDDMKAIMGIYDASLGAKSNETSGKAIMARQREGDTGTYDFIDNRNRAVEHGGRIILDLIPKLYTAERILRCVQEDGSTYTVPVNQPVVPKQELDKLMQPQTINPGPMGQTGPMQPGMNEGGMPQEGPQQAQQGAPEYVTVPEDMHTRVPPEMLEKLKAITKVFDLTAGKYDVMVTAGPGFNTRREEAATQMMEFIRVFPQAAPLIGDLLAKNLDWPGAEQVAERLRAMVPPQAQGQINPMVQQLQQLLQKQDGDAKQAIGQLQQKIAELGKQVQDKNGELQLKAREIGVKEFEAQTKRAEVLKPEAQQEPDPAKMLELQLAERELRVKEYSAETERLKVLGATITPEAITALVQNTVMQALSTPTSDQGAMAVMPMMPMMGEMPEATEQEPVEGVGMDGSMQHEGMEGEPAEPGEGQSPPMAGGMSPGMMPEGQM